MYLQGQKTPFDLAADAEHVHLLTVLSKDEDVTSTNGRGMCMEPSAAAAVAAAAVAAKAAESRSSSCGSSGRSKTKGLVAGMSRLLTRNKGKASMVQGPSEWDIWFRYGRARSRECCNCSMHVVSQCRVNHKNQSEHTMQLVT